MRSITSLVVLPVLLAGCFELELPKGTDTASDTAGEDTAGEDTAGEDTAGEDTAGEDTAGEDTATDVGTASVRFVNLWFGLPVNISVTSGGEGIDSGFLAQTEGTSYQDIPAGDARLVPYDGTEAWAGTDATFEEGKHYSIAYTPEGDMLVSEDDLSDTDSTDSRLNLINVSGETLKWHVGYWNGSGWSGPGYQELEANATATDTYAYADDSVQLELYWPSLDDFLVDWEIVTYLETDPGAMKNIYFWNDGDCSDLGSGCVPMMVAQLEDGSTLAAETIFYSGRSM